MHLNNFLGLVLLPTLTRAIHIGVPQLTGSSTTKSSSSLKTSTTWTTFSSTLSSTSKSALPSTSKSTLSSNSKSSLSSTSKSTSSSAPTLAGVAALASSGPVLPGTPITIGTFNYSGCYLDIVNDVRSLKSGVKISVNMTLEMCAATCAGYNYFGTEYSTECYCGHTLDHTLKTSESECTSACAGNPRELCGTNARLTVYENNIYTPPPPPPAPVSYTNGFAWQSCYIETSMTGPLRSLTGVSYAGSSMTAESCTSFCSGYQYAGLEYGDECYCGNSLTDGAVPAPASECSMTCAGNPGEMCGGPGHLDLYKVGPPKVTVPKYHMAGCYKDLREGHVMPLLVSNKSVTPELCGAIVSSLANKAVPTFYPFYAVENKKECYGGSSLAWGPTITSLVGPKACTATCSGSHRVVPTGPARCGGSHQMNLYVAAGAPTPVASITKVA